MITAGSFEGGDFDIIEPGIVLIGCCGERTQEQSANQVSGWFEKEGWEVKLAPIAEHYVHIDLMVCMLAEKLCAVCLETTEPEIVDLAEVQEDRDRAGQLPGHHGAGVQRHVAGQRQVLAPAHAKDLIVQAEGPRIHDLRSRGRRLHPRRRRRPLHGPVPASRSV